jgi:hypothetical protein
VCRAVSLDGSTHLIEDSKGQHNSRRGTATLPSPGGLGWSLPPGRKTRFAYVGNRVQPEAELNGGGCTELALHPPARRRTELNGRATRVSSRWSRSRRWPTAAWLVASRFRAVCDTAERADGGDACCVLACRVLAVVIDGRRPRYGCVLRRLAARLPSFATTLLACGAPCLPARQRGFSRIQVAVRHSDGRG